MKKTILVAAAVLLAAALAGCAFMFAFPAFLRPEGGPPQSPSPGISPHGTAGTPTATVAETAAPTATAPATTDPTAAPTPTPGSGTFTVIKRYESVLPADLPVDLQYKNYSTPLNYFVALKSGAAYAAPDAGSQKLLSFTLGTRYKLDALVLGADGKTQWYLVEWSNKSTLTQGYIRTSAGAAREFRVGMMLEQAEKLQLNADQPRTVYVVNYKNGNGQPPLLPGGNSIDPYNNRRAQSAPAFSEPSYDSTFRYAPDGLLGTAQGKSGDFTQVYFPSFGSAYWVPTWYLSKQPDCINALTQVVIVDRANQNSGTFELQNGKWTLIAMSYVSTGKQGGFYVKTPLGFFMAQERAPRFYYYYDGTQTIEGYAPYAIRFSGGGYLHGVPRVFHYGASGELVDPGMAESLRTLGTTAQSHMCVRNYTSYAKFAYNWFEKGRCAVIVFE